MKIGVVTTTVNIPTVLLSWVNSVDRIYVAGDLKTPSLASEGPWVYLEPKAQERWRSSEHIGWNTDSRRNIAVLEALKDGCDILVSIDDDMIPLGNNFDDVILNLFTHIFDGMRVGEHSEWVNPGAFMVPAVQARGLPYDMPFENSISYVNDVKIGVVQGNIYGVPDAAACDAIAKRPIVNAVVEPLASGFVVPLEAYAVFNSQLTVFRRELAPFFAQHYKMHRRNTDIIASLAMRSKMRRLGWYTYYGPPSAWHDRSPRPLYNDLVAETYGVELIVELARTFAACKTDADILECQFGEDLFVKAWLEDIAEAMK